MPLPRRLYMQRFDFETEFDTIDFGIIHVHAVGTISTQYPSTMYNPHGDPGDDSEGGEIEYTELTAFDEDDKEITFPDALAEKLSDKAYAKATDI